MSKQDKNTYGEMFARKCDITGQGMNKGFCFGDGSFYCMNESDAITKAIELGYDSLEEAYEDEAYYYTEWNDPADMEWQIINGILTEL